MQTLPRGDKVSRIMLKPGVSTPGSPGAPGPSGGFVCGDPWYPEAFLTHLSCLVSDFEALAQLRFGPYRTGFAETQGAES